MSNIAEAETGYNLAKEILYQGDDETYREHNQIVNSINVNTVITGGVQLAQDMANQSTMPKESVKQNEISDKGYKPQPNERTFEGYVKNNVSTNAEVKLRTDSAGFNNHNGETGGTFKMFGSNSHGDIEPHVHQPYRNVSPTGAVYGGTASGKIGAGWIDTPNNADIKHLYQYLENGMYR